MPEQPARQLGGSPRRLFVVALLAAVAGLALTLSFGYADHDPRPHHVKIAVAAPAPVVQKLAAGLDHAAPGGFDLIRVSSATAAISSVRSQSTAGGFVVPATGATTIVTAGGNGTLEQTAITGALSAAAAAVHRPTRALDVAPLPTGDRSGLSPFVFVLGLLLPSVLASIGLFLLGARFRLWWRVAAATVFALLAACAGTLALDTILGGLTGAGGALIGIGFLGALTFVLFIAGVQAVVGMPGTGLAAVTFVFIGNAISGGSVAIAFLPAGFRQIAPWLPNAAIVSGVRDVVYFSGHHLGHPLVVLGLWLLVGFAMVVGVDLLHLHARRNTPPEGQGAIYATSGLVHARRLLANRHSPSVAAQ